MTLIEQQTQALIEGETDHIAILSNISALLNEMLVDINWVGFYLFEEEHLILGPFQGKVACVHLYPGKGVCSAALEKRKTLCVEDVHAFPGHIACDSASNSELVVPMFVDGKPYGVLDIDSPTIGRFSQEDAKTMEGVVMLLTNHFAQ
ncbi:GAF domain-containing protein [Erysipelothrix sp. HDW6C]|uniref:GAF domain-containing protein n=1 Tax=Erysipelothrix sp. HDW6C TaxID=2714930 RepID=UPI00140B93E5|nr:GAF domain-containing protein [Erysipelothrix sp. HDW6C]QIK69472.1 GAF domain-containing protein [Erysipelothrix sp. HDW6C]